uniref:Uncharacterized protein n=1 Tax=Zea mays TaxID=4577 RepID=A0A804MSU4_MAIZE
RQIAKRAHLPEQQLRATHFAKSLGKRNLSKWVALLATQCDHAATFAWEPRPLHEEGIRFAHRDLPWGFILCCWVGWGEVSSTWCLQFGLFVLTISLWGVAGKMGVEERQAQKSS